MLLAMCWTALPMFEFDNECLNLEVTGFLATQLLPPELRGARDGWEHEQAEKLFGPLHATTLPLSSAAFQTGMEQLRSNLAAQHTVQEARELAQHANREAREDRRDATQTFEGRFGMAKLEEMLHLLNVVSQDDLLELLHALG